MKKKDLFWKEETLFIPKLSEWTCQIFGSGEYGIVWRPNEGQEPNWFWRLMQSLVFGNKWIKEQKK